MKTQNIALFVLVLTVVALSAALLATTAAGAPPTKNAIAPAQTVKFPVTYQGRLTNNTGKPVANTMLTFVFGVYEQPETGSAVWAQTSVLTTTAEGLFTTILEIDPPLGIKDLSSMWLGVKVGTDDEMTPRQRLGGAPFAFTLVPGNGITGTIDTPSSTLRVFNTGTGPALVGHNLGQGGIGVVGASQTGFGGFFASVQGHAMVVNGPMLYKTNLKQVALHRWYEANEANITFTVKISPTATFFDGSSMWVTNQGSNVVSRLRLDGTLMGEYSVGDEPIGITYDGARIWVANGGDGTVTRMMAADPAISTTITVGGAPNGLCFDGRYVWATNRASNNVVRLDAVTGVTNTFTVGASPRTCTFDGTYIWVANYSGNTVTVLTRAGGTVRTVSVGTNPTGVVFDGANVWVTNYGSNSVTKIRASDGTVLKTVTVGAGPRGITFDGYHVWVTNTDANTITKLRVVDDTVVTLIGNAAAVGAEPRGITFDGSDIWVANSGDGTISKK